MSQFPKMIKVKKYIEELQSDEVNGTQSAHARKWKAKILSCLKLNLFIYNEVRKRRYCAVFKEPNISASHLVGSKVYHHLRRTSFLPITFFVTQKSIATKLMVTI